MKIVLYSKVGNQSGDILGKIIATHLPEVQMAVYRTISDLSRSLKQPIGNLSIAILVASDKENLMNIISIRHLFQDIRILLLLPKKETEILTLAHQLRPRFLTDVNSDPMEIIAVLKKMLKS